MYIVLTGQISVSLHFKALAASCTVLILIVLLNNVLDVDLSVPYQPGTFLAPVAPPVSPPLLQLGLLLAGVCTCFWEYLSCVFRCVCVLSVRLICTVVIANLFSVFYMEILNFLMLFIGYRLLLFGV